MCVAQPQLTILLSVGGRYAAICNRRSFKCTKFGASAGKLFEMFTNWNRSKSHFWAGCWKRISLYSYDNATAKELSSSDTTTVDLI